MSGLEGVQFNTSLSTSLYLNWLCWSQLTPTLEPLSTYQKLNADNSAIRSSGSGRLDEFGRPPSPALYRSSSRDNLDQATLSRPASPAPMYRSSSRDNLDLFGGFSRPASPGLSRQNSGNTGYSPRVNVLQPPRSESPVHLRERDPTPERLPRMADWATGMSRKSASMSESLFSRKVWLLQSTKQNVGRSLWGSLQFEQHGFVCRSNVPEAAREDGDLVSGCQSGRNRDVWNLESEMFGNGSSQEDISGLSCLNSGPYRSFLLSVL